MKPRLVTRPFDETRPVPKDDKVDIDDYKIYRSAKHLVSGVHHICCMCGKSSLWDKNWSWYGSEKDSEDGKADKLCSVKCRNLYNKKHRVPLDNRKTVK